MKKLTNREVIFTILNTQDKQEQSDEVGMSLRLIYSHLIANRIQLLYQKSKMDTLGELNYQTIPLLEVIEVDEFDFKCVPPMKCVLLKTVMPIPSFLHMKSITSPINTTGEIFKFTEIEPSIIKYKMSSRFPDRSDLNYFYYQNTGNGVYVFLWSNQVQFLKGISLKGIFYEPHVVEAIKDCSGNLDPCYNYLDAEFPIEPDLLAQLYAMTKQSLLMGQTALSDILNDNLDSIIQNQQYPK